MPRHKSELTLQERAASRVIHISEVDDLIERLENCLGAAFVIEEFDYEPGILDPIDDKLLMGILLLVKRLAGQELI